MHKICIPSKVYLTANTYVNFSVFRRCFDGIAGCCDSSRTPNFIIFKRSTLFKLCSIIKYLYTF